MIKIFVMRESHYRTNTGVRRKKEMQKSRTVSRADPEILKRRVKGKGVGKGGGALCRPLSLADEKDFRFQMV